MNRLTIYSVGLAFVGTIIMNPIEHLHVRDVLGIGSGLLAACFYAFVTISGKKTQHVHPISLTWIQTMIASLLLMPVFALTDWHIPNISSLLVIACIGIFHTAVALSLYFHGLSGVKVSHVGVLGYLDPLSAVLFALLFFHEIPSLYTVVGGTCILLSSYFILSRRNPMNSIPVHKEI